MAENQVNNNKNPCEENTASSFVPDAGGRKRRWPELVGVSAEEAERKVKEEMPKARVQVVPPDCFVTMDFRSDRVRLFLDSTGKVAKAPSIG